MNDGLRQSTVAIISNTSWSIYNFRRGLVNHLLARGHRVVVIAPADDYSPLLEELGCCVEPVMLNQYGMRPWEDAGYLIQLIRLLKRYDADLVFTYTIKSNVYGNLAARVLGLSCVAVVTGLGLLFTEPSLKTRLASILYKLALRRAVQVWFLNHDDKQQFLNKGIITPQQAHYLPSEGVDTGFFRPRPGKPSVGDDRSLTFLFAGRLMREKGIIEYVEAARQVLSVYPFARFEVLGFIEKRHPHGITVQELEQWGQAGWIHYLGESRDIRVDLERADCVVLPSFYREGVPRILLEAASMERPIITTDNVGCTDVVKHGLNGYICRRRDTQDLVHWMIAMIGASSAERAAMGRAGRELVSQSFEEASILHHYNAILSAYLDPPAAAPLPLEVVRKPEYRLPVLRSPAGQRLPSERH